VSECLCVYVCVCVCVCVHETLQKAWVYCIVCMCVQLPVFCQVEFSSFFLVECPSCAEYFFVQILCVVFWCEDVIFVVGCFLPSSVCVCVCMCPVLQISQSFLCFFFPFLPSSHLSSSWSSSQ
jgi:hypothetical protein